MEYVIEATIKEDGETITCKFGPFADRTVAENTIKALVISRYVLGAWLREATRDETQTNSFHSWQARVASTRPFGT